MIEYLIESTFCLAVLLLLFELFYKNARNFKLNRLVLLFSVLFSVIVPSFNIPLTSIPVEELTMDAPIISQLVLTENNLVDNPIIVRHSVTVGMSALDFNLADLLLVFYLLVAGFLLVRFFVNMIVLCSKIYKAEKVNFQGFQLAILDLKIGPFTFFNTICIGRTEFQSKKIDHPLLLHELAHKKELHSFDIILLELLLSVYL